MLRFALLVLASLMTGARSAQSPKTELRGALQEEVQHAVTTPVTTPVTPVSLVSVSQSAGNLLIGCFKDCGTSPEISRDFPLWAYNDNGANTPGKCVAYCASKGYSYAAVQFSSTCFCGNSYGRVGWYTVNSGHSAVRGGNWVDRLSVDYSVTDPTVCAERCIVNPNCKSAMLQTNGPGCVLFPYTCNQTTTACPSWASYNWVGYWEKGGNPYSPPQCNMPCTGDSSQTCGGSCANQVYATSYANTLTHLGCFADSTTRDLPFVAMGDENSVMTPELCAYLCRPKYQFAGLQFSFQCFCGNRYGSQGTSNYCTMPCSGNSSVMCGNGYVSNVYRLF